ncbi:MAG TPA: hypothetical protein VMM82_14015, partial [Spirochaetia bacterium]|nr:hypothetical protein [Spirochaetia bacterium]
MSNEDALLKGIELAQKGDFGQAANYFASVVQTDPTSEDGWFWLGLCVTDPKKREFCFRRVLTLNPNHQEAREQLNILVSPVPPPPAEVGTSEAPVEQTPLPAAMEPEVLPAEQSPAQEPPLPQPTSVSPFIFDDLAAEEGVTKSSSEQAEPVPFLD